MAKAGPPRFTTGGTKTRYKGTITTPAALTAGNIIPFTTAWNTNRNTNPVGDGSVELRAAGYYDVAVMATVTGVTVSPIAIQLYDGETPIAETEAETETEIAEPEETETESVVPEETETTGIHTVNITDTIRVLPNAVDTFARLSARVSGAVTISNAVLTVELRK